MKINTWILILWTLLLLGILFMPVQFDLPSPRVFAHLDQVAHFGLFAITGFVIIYGISFLSLFRFRLLFGLILGLALAAVTELGQFFIPFRSIDFYDLLADWAGLFLGLLSYTFFYTWKYKL